MNGRALTQFRESLNWLETQSQIIINALEDKQLELSKCDSLRDWLRCYSVQGLEIVFPDKGQYQPPNVSEKTITPDDVQALISTFQAHGVNREVAEFLLDYARVDGICGLGMSAFEEFLMALPKGTASFEGTDNRWVIPPTFAISADGNIVYTESFTGTVECKGRKFEVSLQCTANVSADTKTITWQHVSGTGFDALNAAILQAVGNNDSDYQHALDLIDSRYRQIQQSRQQIENELHRWELTSETPHKWDPQDGDFSYKDFFLCSKSLMDNLWTEINKATLSAQDRSAYLQLHELLCSAFLETATQFNKVDDAVGVNTAKIEAQYEPSEQFITHVGKQWSTLEPVIDRVQMRMQGKNPDASSFLEKMIDKVISLFRKNHFSPDVTHYTSVFFDRYCVPGAEAALQAGPAQGG